ncbi:exonuclease subunit SbcD [Pantoea stewartii]|uniref:Nuclease SbcCD subunit D n=1 Tax=Pantoea stewartii subsp. stewartii DC283 TaxID=660596 RepID=H3R887_PANSE|nr:exonuclease subunit SbcD [Pantoea stewartii]ARF48876.1 exonuclease subunit SbcD [Pantoea stewartii subsp. stewartii DC283]EHU02223.1 exonuclease, dsDNA, ATP-dependent [Pantoea stewartii subsp. stewartii DC283]KAB0551660.1 exonuclease subunit SbcD [Pantoea stewartii subsp. stewartii]NRH25324.1 exonuclease subunit SbcD [Pantoea stewartii]
MRIIHTADWHLGQFFYNKSRAAEHQAFLDWLLARIEEHQVDALIVAGDLFDTGTPPSYAREMFNRFVVALQPSGCQLVVLAGNHDSVATLNESRELLACLNTRVITTPQDGNDVLMLTTRQGEPGALLCAIPYLRPRDIMRSQAGQSGRDKQRSLLEAITAHYQRSFAAAQALNLALPIVATGHLTALGVSKSDSVRDIYIGTLDAFPASAFPPADYIALGHIHRAQRVADSDHIRYSGSPIPLSFDELGSEKSVFLLDFSPSGLTVTPLTIPLFQPMQVLKGSLAQITRQLSQFSAPDGTKPVWLDIEVTTQEYLSDLQRQVEALTASLPVDVLLLRRSREQRQHSLAQLDKETLSELNVEEVFARRLALDDALDADQIAQTTLRFKQTLADLEEQP